MSDPHEAPHQLVTLELVGDGWAIAIAESVDRRHIELRLCRGEEPTELLGCWTGDDPVEGDGWGVSLGDLAPAIAHACWHTMVGVGPQQCRVEE